MSGRAHVLIAGGGIGGMAAAVSLLQRGFRVTVLEKAAELAEVGAGVQVSPNAMRVLAALGLKEQIDRVSFVPRHREMRLWNTGEICRSPAPQADMVRQYGFAHITIHRADLHDILIAAAQRESGFALRLASSCVDFEQDADGVRAILADGSSVGADVLVGADGIHSRIRQKLFGVSSAKFTGGLAWRGVLPAARVPVEMRDRPGQNWIGPNGHFIVYPIRRGELINLVGHIDRTDWQVESWYEVGTTEEFARDFEGWHPELQTLIRAVDQPFKWALFLHPTLPRWSVGRVTLLGDACHPMLPYLAQGANQAIEDGLILGRCLDASPGDIVGALRRYERTRIPRTTMVVDESAANIRRYHHPDLSDPAKAKAYVDHAWDDQLELRAEIFRYDAIGAPLAEV